MADILKGAPVAQAMTESFRQEAETLRAQGVTPTLAIVRVGERADDLSYERGAMKRAASMGIDVKQVILPEDVDSDTFFGELRRVNEDADVHGILLFRPLPRHLDGERARQMIDPAKDVDGCTDGSLAGVFTNTQIGFSPCTAQAAMEILHFYGIDVRGKRAAVIGRSLVIGRPVAMMLMHENATVTVCHTRTVDVPSVTREADIVIAASDRRRNRLERGEAEALRRREVRRGGDDRGFDHAGAGRSGKRDDSGALQSCDRGREAGGSAKHTVRRADDSVRE